MRKSKTRFFNLYWSFLKNRVCPSSPLVHVQYFVDGISLLTRGARGVQYANKKPEFSKKTSISLLLLLSLFSCVRTPTIPKHLDHDFLHGTEEDLYRTRDLKMILSETASSSPHKGESSKKYTKILATKESLYSETQQANIFSLKDLLKITTASKGEKVKISSSIENIFIDPNISFLNEYEILDYTVEKPKSEKQKLLKKLLGTVNNFKGFPNTDYYILPYFVGNYLVLYKLGDPDKIPYEELPLAKRVGDKLAVPLVGYPVEYCQAVQVLGSNNIKTTLKFRPVCKALQSNSQYVRLQILDKKVFSYIKKEDFFQRDFFDGRWLYFETEVRSPKDTDRSQPKSGHLVEFHASKDNLEVIESNRLKTADEKRVLFIPVKWRDYEIAKDSNRWLSFSERFKDVNEDRRPYLQIKFNELIRNEFTYYTEGGKSLESVFISKDYISFNLSVTRKNGQLDYIVKHAFKRYSENPDYKEKKWFYEDEIQFFPLYSVARKHYKNLGDHSQADADYFKRTVRFNPQTKDPSKVREIKWYFSTQTSTKPWVRNLGFLAVQLLNQAFQEAGKDSDYKIKIVLEDNADKELGDIRYNILNLVLSPSDKNWRQFVRGNNVADPWTGEMVSATANVWITRILTNYKSLIGQYIRFSIYPPLWKMQVFSKSAITSIKENTNIDNLQCAFAQKSKAITPLYHEPERQFLINSKKPLGVTPFFHEKLSQLCPEVIQFIISNKGKAFHVDNPPLRDTELVDFCAQKMAQEKIGQSILQNMLHSLGLKKMTSSLDSENFYTHKELKDNWSCLKNPISCWDSRNRGNTAQNHNPTNRAVNDSNNSILEQQHFSLITKTQSHPAPPQYSSVTTVMDEQYPILSIPGKLDIATLRFLYFDKLNLTQKGQVLEIPSGENQKSILHKAQEQNWTKQDIKKYKICGQNSPLIICLDKDYGGNLIEMASNNICKIHNDLLLNRNRYDSIDLKYTLPSSSPLTRILWRWFAEIRANLLKSKELSIKDYSFLNPQHVEDYKDLIKEVTKNSSIKDYIIVRNLIFDYVKRLLFAPAKHCIYKVGGQYKAIALENIEKKILNNYDRSDRLAFRNCKSPIVQTWADQNLEDSQLITEVGFWIKNRRYLIQPDKKNDPIDEWQAFNFFEVFSNRFDHLSKEVDLMAEYYKEWKDYITQGTDLNPYIDRTIITSPLERVLSYKIDSMPGDFEDIKNLWELRLLTFKQHKSRNSINSQITTNSSNLFRQNFYYQAFSLSDLKEALKSFVENTGLYTDFSFLTKVFEEYKTERDKEPVFRTNIFPSSYEDFDLNSFVNFIQQHPAVFHDQDKEQYRLPFEDNNILSQMHRQYNKYLKCIERQEQQDCPPLEEMQAFKNLMLDLGEDIFQNSL